MAEQIEPGNPAIGITRTAAAAIAAGALAGLGGVALGAYAAHDAPPELRSGLETAALYASIHGLAMIGAALIYDRTSARHGALIIAARWIMMLSMGAFALGIIFFSGALFLSSIDLNPGTAAQGGMLLIGGWAGLVLAALAILFARRRQ